MNRRYLPFVLLCCSIVLSAAAQLLMKAGMLEYRSVADTLIFDFNQLPHQLQLHASLLLWLLAGFTCYGLSMLAWLLALTRYDISYAYPMLGLSYVLVYLGAVSWPLIGEAFSFERTLGIVLVLVGVALVNIKKGDAAL